MNFKAICLTAIHKLYRSDPWLKSLYETTGLTMDEISKELDRIQEDKFFYSASEKAVIRYEHMLKIIPDVNQTLDERRYAVRAKWIGTGKVDLQLLQDVADSWKNGLINLLFEQGKIHVTFNSPVGVPNDLVNLKLALEKVKPAHLAIFYTFLWLIWRQTKEFGTWGDHKNNGTWLDIKRLKE